MGEKSVNKKNFILEKATEIFSKKGYLNTTMKDVVDACEISRGGVYLYFEDIKDLFEAVMEYAYEDIQAVDSKELEKLSDDATYADVLALFIKERKKSILSKKPNLTVAIYEYYFENKVNAKNNNLKKEFDMSLFFLEQLIKDGIDAGEFYDIDAHRAASNLMFVLEGLRVASKSRGLSESIVDEEIMYVMQGIIAED